MDLEIRHLALRYATLRVLDPGRVSRLAASLVREGQRTPVLVVGEVLVDGYHRVEALRTLGRDLVAAVALETHGLKQAALASALARPRSWVSQRRPGVEHLVRTLPEPVQEAVRRGRISAEAASKSLLPMARMSAEGCARLVAGLTEPVTKRQVEQIYATWRASDAEARARIEAHPMLLLKVEAASETAPLDAVEQLASDFEAIAGICRRAHQRCRAGVFGQPNSRLLSGTWTQAREAYQALQEEISRARSGHPNGHPEAARGGP